MSDKQRRLYRSQTNKIVAGVCGGLAEYLNIDVTLIRLIWILITFLGGSGILIYIIAYFIIPEQPIELSNSSESIKSDFAPARIFGIIFVVAGVLILLDNLDILSFSRWWYLTSDFIFPSLLILIGIYLLAKRGKRIIQHNHTSQSDELNMDMQNNKPEFESKEKPELGRKKLYRSKKDKKILGICGGAGEFFDIDSTIIRIAYVIFTLLSGGFGLLLYFILYLVIPENNTNQENK